MGFLLINARLPFNTFENNRFENNTLENNMFEKKKCTFFASSGSEYIIILIIVYFPQKLELTSSYHRFLSNGGTKP